MKYILTDLVYVFCTISHNTMIFFKLTSVIPLPVRTTPPVLEQERQPIRAPVLSVILEHFVRVRFHRLKYLDDYMFCLVRYVVSLKLLNFTSP